MPTKSFRGLIANGAVDTVVLHTNTGSTGYRIKKMQMIGEDPGNVSIEATIKIFTIPQTIASVNSVIDFSDNTLLAAGHYNKSTSVSGPLEDIIIFDNMTFNQDIYITCSSTVDTSCNYYIELEQVKLALDENTVATLKDIRNIAQPANE